MADYTDREKAVMFDEICAALDQTDWVQIFKTPGDDSWTIQIDGNLNVSASTAEALQGPPEQENTDG